MIWSKLYTRYEFNTERKAAELFEFLENSGGVFSPTRFGSGEPVRKRYVAGSREEVVNLLWGSPKYTHGAIFLKGVSHHALSVFRWVKSRVSTWELYLDDEFLRGPEKVQEFINLLTSICNKFPLIFGWAAPDEDWRAKHWQVEYDERGRSRGSRKLGTDLENGLPGVYWITIFGPHLTRCFGGTSIAKLPVHRVLQLHEAGTGIIVRESPYEPLLTERLEQDRRIMELLGAQYFFDIKDPAKKVIKILDDLNDSAD
jgi:hypothetical protein